MRKIKVGIMSEEKIRERALAIARGDHRPLADEPKIWCTSMQLVIDTLSDEQSAVRKAIIEATSR